MAAECADDPNECTPKKLCQAATNLKGGNTSWSTASSKAKHVTLALSLGMSCGVVAIVDPCDLDPNECKISKLCEKATKSNNGQTVWNSAAQSYVDVAKEYELTCDVKTENAAAKTMCSLLTPESCLAPKLCNIATVSTGNTITWSMYDLEFVWEAKKRGLSCGVGNSGSSEGGLAAVRLCALTPNPEACLDAAAVTKTCNSLTPEVCEAPALCKAASYASGNSRLWFGNRQSFVKEAKKRGLTCGVGEPTTTAVEKKCNATYPEVCNKYLLCDNATSQKGYTKLWTTTYFMQVYVKEARKRGLTCGVKTKIVALSQSAESQSAELKKVFSGLSTLERKQMQYALKKLGYYQSTVDGIWGRKTLAALSSFIRSERIKPRNALFNLTEMVNVPSSFAVAKRPSTSSSSSSSASSSSGLTAIVSSPSVPANQAIAICEPMASQAASNAENSYSAPKTKKSYRGKCKKDYFGDFDCSVRDSTSSGGFAAGFANAASGWLDGRKAGSRAYKSCLASYGWRKN